MKSGHTYYQWKEQGELGELFTPHGDPHEYEYPFDYLFDSVEDAYAALEDLGIVEQYFDEMELDEDMRVVNLPEKWHPEGWVLVKTVSEVVEG